MSIYSRQVGGNAPVPAMNYPNGINAGAPAPAAVPATGGNGCNNLQFKEFTGASFTLVGDNSAGLVAANWKMQSADDVVECIQGTLGANVFDVNELPNRAGLALGGANLLGIDALRKRLLMFGLLISYINYSSTTAAQLNNPVRVIYGYLDGSSYTDTKSVSKDANNQQFVATLIPITGEWILTGNAALQLQVGAGEVAQLTFAIKTQVTYSRVM